MKQININYPWKVLDGGEKLKVNLFPKNSPPIPYEKTAEDTCIVDADGFEVVGCSEWIRGDENFERIVLCVNACKNFTDEELLNKCLTLKEPTNEQ